MNFQMLLFFVRPYDISRFHRLKTICVIFGQIFFLHIFVHIVYVKLNNIFFSSPKNYLRKLRYNLWMSVRHPQNRPFEGGPGAYFKKYGFTSLIYTIAESTEKTLSGKMAVFPWHEPDLSIISDNTRL